MRLPNWGPRPHNSQFLAIRQKSPQSLQTFSLATAGEQAQPGVAVTARKSMLPKDLPRLQRHLGVLVDRHYSGATRYTTSGFLRMKLGDALAGRDVAPHIYESAEEARAHLRELGEGSVTQG